MEFLHLVKLLRTVLRQAAPLGNKAVNQAWSTFVGALGHLLGALALQLLMCSFHLLLHLMPEELVHWMIPERIGFLANQLTFAAKHVAHLLAHPLHPLHHLSEDALSTVLSLPAEAMMYNRCFAVFDLNLDVESLVWCHYCLLKIRIASRRFDILEKMTHDLWESTKGTCRPFVLSEDGATR
jgi:hypothetical protein